MFPPENILQVSQTVIKVCTTFVKADCHQNWQQEQNH